MDGMYFHSNSTKDLFVWWNRIRWANPISFPLRGIHSALGICKFYEQKLRMQNPALRNITYDISELYAYIDDLPDLGVLA